MQHVTSGPTEDARHPIVGLPLDEIEEGVDEGIGSILSLGDGQSENALHRLAVYEVHEDGGQAIVYVGIYLNRFEKHETYDLKRFLLPDGSKFSFLHFLDYGLDFRMAYEKLDRSYKRAFRILKQHGRPGDAADVFNTNILHPNVLRIEHFIFDPDSYERYAYILEAADYTLSEYLQLKEGAPLKDVRHEQFLDHWMQIFRGMEAVHAHSRFCADISPNNTFINLPDRTEESYTLKLGDFFANQATLEARVALHGWAGLNNPLLMAPEEFGLVIDTIEANQLIDVYRVCAMLHRTVFGRYPVSRSWDDEQEVYRVKAELASRIREMQVQFLLKQNDPVRAVACEKEEHRLSVEMRTLARDLVEAKAQYFENTIQNTGLLDEQLMQLGVGDPARAFLLELFQRGLAPHQRRLPASEIVNLYDRHCKNERRRRRYRLARAGAAVLTTLSAAATVLWMLFSQTGWVPLEGAWQLANTELRSYVNLPEPPVGWRLPTASELQYLFDRMPESERNTFFDRLGWKEPDYPVFFSSDTFVDDENEVSVVVYDLNQSRQDTLHQLDIAHALWVGE